MREASAKKTEFIQRSISKSQAEGTGMAMVLILLLIGHYTNAILYFKIAVPALLVTMTIPKLYYPLAIVWFTLSNLLSKVMPTIILTVVYALLVTPLGLVRKLLGHDQLQLRQWKKSSESVMKIRNHTYSSLDLDKPY
jgi:hypothetical protein